MENANTLDSLLQIEAKAAALVSDAQAEADRRINENEAKNHAAYEECYRTKVLELEASLKEEKEKIKLRYQNELDQYRKEISNIEVNTKRFCALLNGFISEGYKNA